MSLALWLRTGRTERGLSLDDVARITKIQPRILERLEGGKLDGLPAEVFVRGFIRSFARCCGLDEAEALSRYTAASQAQAISPAPVSPSSALAAPPAARAVVEAMADLAPQAARTTSPKIEVVDLSAGSVPEIATAPVAMAAPAEDSAIDAIDASADEARPSKKKHRGKKRAKRKSMATGTPSAATPVVVEAAAVDSDDVDVDAGVVDAAAPVEAAPVEAAPVEAAPVVVTPAVTSDASVGIAVELEVLAPVDHLDPLVEPPADEDVVVTETWQPKMPAPTTTATVPWRRPAFAATATAAASVPTLVIDDADPESAEQVLEDREAARSVLTNAQRRSFLPPILLDREDRSARQGGLTLAVIILLIAATLTLSYLMRRPSSSGDGVTRGPTSVETQPIG